MQPMLQRLDFAGLHLERTHDDDRPYVIVGRRAYAIGMMSGAPPRVGDEHLVGEMGGFWAHPIKALDAWGVRLNDDDLGEPLAFNNYFWGIERVRAFSSDLVVRELEWIDEDERALFVRVQLENRGTQPRAVLARYFAQPHLRPCWMSVMLDGKDSVQAHPDYLLATDAANPGWAVAVYAPAGLTQSLQLAPGEQHAFWVIVAVVHEGGAAEALRLARHLLPQAEQRLAHKQAAYRAAAQDETTPSNALDFAYRCARLNLKLLEADYPAGHYPIAGLPEYPNLFGCDVAYSAVGLCLGGQVELAADALRALGAVMARQCGRTPHEVLPSGEVFHPGNTQEIAQFVSAVWRISAYVADGAAFLHALYPVCRAGLLNYLRSGFTQGGSRFPHYPFGNAMVEREGMLPLKLDAVCYTWRALRDLARMAQALAQNGRADFDYAADADEAQRWADAIAASFERDWWIEAEGLYADSLGWDGQQQLDRHWTQIVPLEVELAAPEHAERVLDALERGWLNTYGLPHTKDADERVWTLGNGILALIAARHRRGALAERLLHNIAETLYHGQLGLFEELIPHGLCFVQLWSAALFIEAYAALRTAAA
ncbi:MAG: hypothetical protein NZ532_06505 [Thermoflexales bacterium]|nr:hypothetical protein [Thermoflexales bacterium]